MYELRVNTAEVKVSTLERDLQSTTTWSRLTTGESLADTHLMSGVTSTGNSYYVTEGIIQAWEYMYTFISIFHFEALLKHFKRVWHLNSHKCFKAHKSFYCIDIFILLQTNLNIDITSSSMLMYYIFIDLFDPAGYYSPKKPQTKQKLWKKCIFYYFCDSRKSVKLRLFLSQCFHA